MILLRPKRKRIVLGKPRASGDDPDYDDYVVGIGV